MDLEVDKCSRCGASLRDIDPFENNKPVTLSKNRVLCSQCYKELVDQLTLDNL